MRLSKKAWEHLLEHAKRCLPEEACGLLGGHGDWANAFYPVTNALHSPTEFFMEPSEQLRAFKQLLQDGYELVAIFHSHPPAPPIPSRRDLERAYDFERRQPYHPSVRHLILSLMNPEHPVAKCYRLTDDGEFVEEELSIEDD
jgi:proteasome lid subunit RPN8/RPN11